MARGGAQGPPGAERLSGCSLQIFERDLKRKGPEAVPLEFVPAQGLLGRPADLCAQHFALS